MNIPVKKLKNGFSIPVYGLGTWEMGGRAKHDATNDDKRDILAIRQALENGVFHIDTAESYAEGYAEQLIAKAISNYDRKSLFLASKAHVDHLDYDGLINAAKESIIRLGVSYLDLYYAHQFSLRIPVKETMRAMDTLVDEGLIKDIGVSNFNLEELQEARSYSKHGIVANQLHLNLLYREPQRRGLLEYCQKNDIMFVAWRPLQKGMLLSGIGLLSEMAEKYHKTQAQIAINWLISQDNVVTLSKTARQDHLLENLGAIGWQMDKYDIEKLDHNFPGQLTVSDAVPLH